MRQRRLIQRQSYAELEEAVTRAMTVGYVIDPDYKNETTIQEGMQSLHGTDPSNHSSIQSGVGIGMCIDNVTTAQAKALFAVAMADCGDEFMSWWESNYDHFRPEENEDPYVYAMRIAAASWAAFANMLVLLR